MTRLRSGKDISDVGDSTNNPPVNTTGDDTEQHGNLVLSERTQSVSGAPTGFDGQEIENVETTATATAIEGLDTQDTIYANEMKEVSNSLVLISAAL